MRPKRVLFLCTSNSCRSHMAEGWFRSLAGDRYESLSAGSKPAGYVHPLAVAAMAEVGVDLSAYRSKSIQDFVPPRGDPPDTVVSVCSNAETECPIFPISVARHHWPFEDPAHAEGSDEEKLAVFRRVRDEIRDRLERALAEGEL